MKYLKIPLHARNQIASVYMKQCSLRKRRQCFVCALNHNIRPQRNRRLRIVFSHKRKMRAMRLVHNQRYVIGFQYLKDSTDIRYHSLICRRSQYHNRRKPALCRQLFQCFFVCSGVISPRIRVPGISSGKIYSGSRFNRLTAWQTDLWQFLAARTVECSGAQAYNAARIPPVARHLPSYRF